MRLRVLGPGEPLSAPRGHAVVCLLCDEDDARWRESLVSVDIASELGVAIVLLGSDLEGIRTAVEPAAGDRELWLIDTGGIGSAGGINRASSAAPLADLVLLWPGARPGQQWLERMREAAYCDTTVISASALCGSGELLEVAASPLALPIAHQRRADPRAAAQAVAAGAGRVYPRISQLAGPCVYLRREALQLVGPLSERESVTRAVAALGARALARGMLHVAADDVYVTLTGEGELAGGAREDVDASTLQATELQVPADADIHDERAMLRGCLKAAQAALDGLSVTLDARALVSGLGGTQVYTIELALALARLDGIALRMIVPPDLPQQVEHVLAEVARIELVPYAAAAGGELARSHIVHRPQQVFSEDDVNLLRLLGERIVISHQDLIAYRNPGYHLDLDHWQRYRRVTRMALAVADQAVFFSEHALLDAVGEGLIPREHAVASGIGGDELWPRGGESPERPEGAPSEEPFLLCLGADYQHKNRPFAIALLAALRELGWPGYLVFAGPHVTLGSSAADESLTSSAHPELSGRVRDCGPVSEAGRAWLMGRARAVVYPSLYEGFGLLPFEAARAGVPCLYAPQAALAETAGIDAATLLPWDTRASASRVVALLEEGPERDAHLALLRAAARRTSWSDVADHLHGVYARTLAAPHRSASPRVWEELQRERRLRELSDAASSSSIALRSLQDSVGILAGPEHGGVLTEAERRGLLRVASRRFARRALLGPIGLLGRRW